MRRYRTNRRKDRKMYSRTASHVNSRNMTTGAPMRGGIRL